MDMFKVLLLTQNNSQGKISISAQSSDLEGCLPQWGSTDCCPLRLHTAPD